MSTFDIHCAARARSWLRGHLVQVEQGSHSVDFTKADRLRQQTPASIKALKDLDCAASAHVLPRQTKCQGLKLLGIQFQLANLSSAQPLKFALVQTACRQPNADPVKHRHFHSVGTSIGKQKSATGLRRTEYRNDSGQRGLGTSMHIHGLGGEPDGINADHRNRSRRKVAQTAALSVGQLTLTVPRGCSRILLWTRFALRL